MTVYYYILDCHNKHYDNNIYGKKFYPIKTHTDGQKVAIISDKLIEGLFIVQKTEKELQDIINEWIAEENKTTEINIDNQEIVQSHINVKKFRRLFNG